MTPQLLTRYRFLRRAGWNKAIARRAVLALAGRFFGHFTKSQE